MSQIVSNVKSCPMSNHGQFPNPADIDSILENFPTSITPFQQSSFNDFQTQVQGQPQYASLPNAPGVAPLLNNLHLSLSDYQTQVQGQPQHGLLPTALVQGQFEHGPVPNASGIDSILDDLQLSLSQYQTQVQGQTQNATSPNTPGIGSILHDHQSSLPLLPPRTGGIEKPSSRRWTRGQLKVLERHLSGGFTQSVYTELMSIRGPKYTEEEVIGKMRLMKSNQEKQFKKKIPWCQKELEVLAKHRASKNTAAAIAELESLGFQRPRQSVDYTMLKTKRLPMTLEQRNDIRELNAIHPQKWARIGLIMGTDRVKIRQYMKSSIPPSESEPLIWTDAEDISLLKGIEIYGPNNDWQRIKEPLIGRSIGACKRRYEILNRDKWDDFSSSALSVDAQAYLDQCRANNQVPDWNAIAAKYSGTDAIMCELHYRMLSDDTFS